MWSLFPDKVFPEKEIDKKYNGNLIQQMFNCKVFNISFDSSINMLADEVA